MRGYHYVVQQTRLCHSNIQLSLQANELKDTNLILENHVYLIADEDMIIAEAIKTKRMIHKKLLMVIYASFRMMVFNKPIRHLGTILN